jgi:methylated-DNA-protein-cysteine methyltransferase-like protein
MRMFIYFAQVSIRSARPKRNDRTPAGGLRPDELRNAAFRRVILSIPKGKVATYGVVAEAAGYPRYHRAVAQFLRSELTDRVPWQRVVGAGGEIKLHYEAAAEQRLRLRMEGVTFRGKKVDMKLHQHSFTKEKARKKLDG